MKKLIIAVDIDDVLAANAEGFITFTNKNWGHNFGVHEYTENWTELWGVDIDEAERRSVLFHKSGIVGEYKHFTDAENVLKRLAQKYDLVVVTSRRRLIEQETRTWLDERFLNVFSAVHFAGLYDNGVTESTYNKTKADVLQSIGATYLIDDQLKHCIADESCGVKALLFGDYSWNNNAPAELRRCISWQEVEKALQNE